MVYPVRSNLGGRGQLAFRVTIVLDLTFEIKT
jgi:hypothetical protein